MTPTILITLIEWESITRVRRDIILGETGTNREETTTPDKIETDKRTPIIAGSFYSSKDKRPDNKIISKKLK